MDHLIKMKNKVFEFPNVNRSVITNIYKKLPASDWLKTSSVLYIIRMQSCNMSANYKKHARTAEISSVSVREMSRKV